MPDRVTFEGLRQRAYELADTGDHCDWRAIGAEMESDGYERATSRLKADPILPRMLDARCEQARIRNA